jgi:threonine dehydrogenase-like Zn-dependent dehydrogenase
VVFEGTVQIEVKDKGRPELQAPTDALLRVTTAAICGSEIVSHRIAIGDAPDAYRKFDERTDGYTKVLIRFDQAA